MHEPPDTLDERRRILSAWEQRCRRRHLDIVERCSGQEAFYLLTAIETAVTRGAQTPHLGRAARNWGAKFSSPGDVIAALSCLREVVIAEGGIGASADGMHLVLDQLMLDAVDAASRNLRDAARTDPLTGCANRRALDEDLGRAVSNARHSGLELAVAAIDLDGLKQVNDTHGHAAGDGVLLALVATLRQSLRDSDTLYRTGGDEFVVLAPFTDVAGAGELMQRAVRLGGPPFSWGVAGLEAGLFEAVWPAPETLLNQADVDLYDRRRKTRRARVLSMHRRRAVTAVSVAASLAATVGGATYALQGGNGPGPGGATAAAIGGWPSVPFSGGTGTVHAGSGRAAAGGVAAAAATHGAVTGSTPGGTTA